MQRSALCYTRHWKAPLLSLILLVCICRFFHFLSGHLYDPPHHFSLQWQENTLDMSSPNPYGRPPSYSQHPALAAGPTSTLTRGTQTEKDDFPPLYDLGHLATAEETPPANPKQRSGIWAWVVRKFKTSTRSSSTPKPKPFIYRGGYHEGRNPRIRAWR